MNLEEYDKIREQAKIDNAAAIFRRQTCANQVATQLATIIAKSPYNSGEINWFDDHYSGINEIMRKISDCKEVHWANNVFQEELDKNFSDRFAKRISARTVHRVGYNRPDFVWERRN